jgi:hypothetical protein
LTGAERIASLGAVNRRLQRRFTARLGRSLAAGLAVVALLVTPALPLAAAALRLTIPAAEQRSLAFAKRTCDRDKHCIDFGVMNCRRDGPRVVFCRIFDERHTSVQGRYRCHRLIRLGFDPETRRKPVTGLGRWHCG